VTGASNFPQNAGYNPTGTLAALAFWSRKPFAAVISEPGAAGACMNAVWCTQDTGVVAGMSTGAARVSLVIILLPWLALCSAAPVQAATFGASDQQNFAQIERGRYLTASRIARRAMRASITRLSRGPADRDTVRDAPGFQYHPGRRHGYRQLERCAIRCGDASRRMPDGSRLYPAMPYAYYTKMSRADVLAIRAYLNTVPPVHHEVESNQLPFPYRCVAHGDMGRPVLQGGRVPRGPLEVARVESRRLLVEGAGHCGACHTPKTSLGGTS